MKADSLKWKRSVISVILQTVLIGLTFYISTDIKAPTEEQLLSIHGNWELFLWKVDKAISQPGWTIFLLIGLVFLALAFYIPVIKKKDRKWIIPLAVCFSAVLLLSASYHKYYDWRMVFGGKTQFFLSVIKGAGMSVIFAHAMSVVSAFAIRSREPSDRFRRRKGSFWKRFCALMVCWIPYMIIFFPGCANSDMTDQIGQLLNHPEHARSATRLVLRSAEVLLNNHHPVAYTKFLEIFVRLGEGIRSYAWAFEIYCLIQCAVLAATLAAQVMYLEKRCATRRLPVFAFVFFALNPIFPIWGMTVMKDVYFSILFFWIIVIFYGILREKETVPVKKLAVLSALFLVWMLVRNNGFYILILLLPFVVIRLWKKKKILLRVLAAFLIPMLIFQGGFQSLLLPALNITGGSPREMLSVPFMQTARLLRDHPESFSKEDEELLLKIFDPNDGTLDEVVERYNKTPDRSDSVKWIFNKTEGPQNLGAYFKLWAKGLVHHPKVYLQAFFCLTYSWFVPESHHDNRFYNGIRDEAVAEMLPDFANPASLDQMRGSAGKYVSILAKIPFTMWAVEFSFYTWACVVFLVIMILRKRKNELLAIGIILLDYVVCFAGPVAYLRYALPAIVCFPALLYLAFRSDEEAPEALPADETPAELPGGGAPAEPAGGEVPEALPADPEEG